MIQDIFPHKLDNSFKNLKPNENDFAVYFCGDSVLVKEEKDGNYSFTKIGQFGSKIKFENYVYMFSVDNERYFLLRNGDRSGFTGECKLLPLSDVRKMKYGYFKKMYFLICTAWHLHSWYVDNRFCGRCGRILIHDESERMLYCKICAAKVYPRISPAVIVGVINGDKIIMSKYAGRDYKGYALLSGFAEIGETLEQTVEREVMEEVGVKVKNIKYYKSQPGGIDGNMLAGFFCELDGDDTLTVDKNELAMARWFRRDEIPVEDDGFSLTFEMIGKFKNQTF